MTGKNQVTSKCPVKVGVTVIPGSLQLSSYKAENVCHSVLLWHALQ